MARKKSVRKATRRTTRNKRISSRKINFGSTIKLLINNLLLFIALSLVFFVLVRFVVVNSFLTNLFFIIAIVFACLSAAFLIALIVFYVLKIIRKR